MSEPEELAGERIARLERERDRWESKATNYIADIAAKEESCADYRKQLEAVTQAAEKLAEALRGMEALVEAAEPTLMLAALRGDNVTAEEAQIAQSRRDAARAALSSWDAMKEVK